MTSAGYSEWSPPADLATAVACLWRGRVDPAAPYTDTVLPDGCVDLIWDGRRLFVAGPDTGPVPLEHAPARTFVGIRMRPGHAAELLHCPAFEILDRRVDVADLWNARRCRRLADMLAAAQRGTGPATSSVPAAAPWLARIVRRQLAARPGGDRLVDGLIALLNHPSTASERERAAGPLSPQRRIAALANDLGVTPRSLHRRCTTAVGYGPKTLERILRFRRAQLIARRAPALSLAELAMAAGYSDQAHLTRECRRLAGRTPAKLFSMAAPIVRNGVSESFNTPGWNPE